MCIYIYMLQYRYTKIVAYNSSCIHVCSMFVEHDIIHLLILCQDSNAEGFQGRWNATVCPQTWDHGSTHGCPTTLSRSEGLITLDLDKNSRICGFSSPWAKDFRFAVHGWKNMKNQETQLLSPLALEISRVLRVDFQLGSTTSSGGRSSVVDDKIEIEKTALRSVWYNSTTRQCRSTAISSHITIIINHYFGLVVVFKMYIIYIIDVSGITAWISSWMSCYPAL